MENSSSQFTVENVEKSLHQFYNDVHTQAQANQFLMLAQISPEAWNFAWQLLHPSKPSEVQFFGASTLHVKMAKHWHELPDSFYAPLRDKLLTSLFNYASGPRIICTRLCIAMSSFIIQTVTDFWPTAIADLIAAFQPHNIPNASPQQIAHVLLELLTILSEEFHTTYIPQGRVGVVRNALRSSLTMVMDLVQSILSKTTSPVELCEISLKCYSTWALLGSTILEYKSLLLLTFDSVYREEISQTALETLCNIANHPDTVKHPKFILDMIEHLTKFDTILERAILEEDMDKASSIYGLIITVADNHSQLLIDTILDKPEKKDMILKLISFILRCSSTPGYYPVDEVCSEQAFGFWYTLQDTIVSTNRGFESLLLVFHPIFQSLVDTYLVKLRYPSDEVYKLWKSEEKESFRCYRQDIGDSLMYCYNILRHASLANLMAHISIATQTATKDPNQWQYLEACLYAFKGIAENVDVKESCYIPMFMNHLRSVPLQHMKIISATMDAIGAFADWITYNPDIIGCVVPLLLMGLQNTEVAVSATFALKDITRNICPTMRPYAEQILHACLDAMKGNILKSREKVRVMCTIGKVLSIMPYSFIMNYLDSLLSPIFSELQDLLSTQASNSNISDTIVLDLHMLSMLFSTLNTHWKETPDEGDPVPFEPCEIRKENMKHPQPVLFVLEKLITVIKCSGYNWEVNEQITEALADSLKRSVSTLFDDCKILLPDILNLLLHLYKHCPHSSVLEVTKHLLMLFSKDDDQRITLTNYFIQVCETTVKVTMADFRENTNVIESFVLMLEHVIKRALVFFMNDAINPIVLFQIGIAALILPEKPTVKAASGFLAEFISHSREVPNMLNAVNNQGEMLVMQVMKVIGGDSPRPVVEYMPDILMALNKKYFDNLCRWMVPFTQQEGFPSARVSQKQKEEFMRQIIKERTNKRKLKETVTEFSLLCRGLIGTEYAAQSCQSFS